MKSSRKKSVSFRIGGDGSPPVERTGEHKSPAPPYEKRYFQAMLARLSQQRPKSSFNKASRNQEEQTRRRRQRPRSGGDIFAQPLQSAGDNADKPVFERRRKAKVSSSPSSSCSASSSPSSSSSSSPSGAPQMEVVGVRSAMGARRTPSPSSLFAARSPPPLQRLLPTRSKLSRSREILHRIQDELSQARGHFSERALSSRVRPLSCSLNEISHLVMELDNNLSVDPSRRNEKGPEEEESKVSDDVSDARGARNDRAYGEVKAESLLCAGQIGRGCFAHVFRAKLFETAVAVKQFKEEDSGRRCLREAAQLSRIRHPNVANLVAVCLERNALVLELVEGEALGAVLRREEGAPLLDGPDGILAVCRHVLLALNYLHHLYPESMIHLDVKSDNVLVSRVGRGGEISAKLCDFGSARRLRGGANEILLGGVTGTPAWMSPEVVEQRYVGVKADVYSFGVVLWEMLTGQIPYDGMELEEVCASICRGEHPILRPGLHRRVFGGGDGGIYRVMASCWNLCPSARPSCAQLLADLAKVKDAVNQRSVPSPPPPPPPPPAPHTRPPRPEGLLGSPEEKRSLVSAAMGFNVTREDLEAQRSRLRRTETPAPADEHEEEIEAATSSLLSQIMKKAIRERRADSGWGQRDSSNTGDSRSSNCQSPWSATEDADDQSSR